MAALYLDEDVAIRLASLLADRGHFVTTVDREGRKGAPDPRQLLYAAERGWILVTHNREHFSLLHDAWLTWAYEWGTTQRHHGVLVIARVQGVTPEVYAEHIHALVSDPDVDLNTVLYDWKPTIGWRRWPR